MVFNASCDVASLYIHWPFCPYKCHFCPFVALASHDEYMGQYHRALTKEIMLYGEYANKVPIKTIFFGGGTPSTYPPDLLLDTFGILKSTFELDATCEITLEVNPGTVTQEKIQAWKRAGITRLSIGVQSLNNTVLSSLNRHQKAADVIELLNQAAPHFQVLSVDLILGLPGISLSEWQELIKTAVGWPIKHISVYFLTVHEDTPLYYGVARKKIKLPTDDVMVDTYHWTAQVLEEHGFMQYEISNFARNGFESRHNSVYWKRLPYKGFGMGACSFDGTSRFQTEKNLMNYLNIVEKANSMQELEKLSIVSEMLTENQVWIEELMLGLRQKNGISWSVLHEKLSPEKLEFFKSKIDEFVGLGYIINDQQRFWLTTVGRAVENEIVVALLE
ncbi:MAG: radical SAM family heme chaperone HemW [Candidatus Babeliaceae bacterium]|nr:radical SAM family heme chaperone HemW [Candidatus Babeliaceae bacterium]